MTQSAADKLISSYIIQSQEEEIKRIALELHEGVGQTLYSMYTGLQFVEKSTNGPIQAYVNEMSQLMEKTIQEVRLLAVELHPPTLTTLGLIPAIKSYLRMYTTTYGIIVDLQVSGTEFPISETSKITLFRVCQEALGNIARYADSLDATIVCEWNTNALEVTIIDRGKGFIVSDVIGQSSGLAAMQERMNLIGGKCLISSTEGKGTSIKAILPL